MSGKNTFFFRKRKGIGCHIGGELQRIYTWGIVARWKSARLFKYSYKCGPARGFFVFFGET